MDGIEAMKIAVTGAKGLLGWHAAARIHAGICSANFIGETPPYDLVEIDRGLFSDSSALATALQGVGAILHFAGINRGDEYLVEQANPEIARALIAGCTSAGINPHIVYANSTHAARDTSYGRSKKVAGELLEGFAADYTDLVLPHIFGECARPYYNNVTATLIDKIWKEELPEVNPGGRVQLLHAGAAVQIAIDAIVAKTTGQLSPQGHDISIADLYAKLEYFHDQYSSNIFPDVNDPFDLALFNSYRTAGYPDHYPKPLPINRDHRGMLFETAKGGTGPQSFISTTFPGKTRGDHFHLDLVERFLVVKGEAVIRIRRVLTNDVHAFKVTGDQPVAIDMPPLHTHNIENVGSTDLTTFFWSNRIFDPANTDTFADSVERE